MRKSKSNPPDPRDDLLPGELPPLGAGREKRGKRRRHPKAIYRVIAVLLCCAAALLIWMNREALKPQNLLEWVQTQFVGMGIGDGYPASLNGASVKPANFCSVDRDLYLTSETTILCMNDTAKTLFSRMHNFADPVMRVNGSRVLVYNRGGTGFRVENQLRTLVSGEAEGTIYCGDVASNGRYALVTTAGGYCGQLTAYLSDNTVAFRYWFSDDYPTAIALSPDGTKAAVAAVGASEGSLKSVLYVLDFNSDAAVSPIAAYPDTYFSALAFDGSNLLAVGDTQAVALSADGTERGRYDYAGQSLQTYTFDGGKAVLALGDFQNATNSTLVHLDANASPTASATLPGQIADVSCFGDAMAALSGGTISTYSCSSGTALGTADAGGDARAIALRTEGEAYVLGVSEVRRVPIS